MTFGFCGPPIEVLGMLGGASEAPPPLWPRLKVEWEVLGGFPRSASFLKLFPNGATIIARRKFIGPDKRKSTVDVGYCGSSIRRT